MTLLALELQHGTVDQFTEPISVNNMMIKQIHVPHALLGCIQMESNAHCFYYDHRDN